MTRHSHLPDVLMPEAAARAAAVPDEPIPEEQMPVGAMPVGEKTPTKGEQGTMNVHAWLQRPAHLGQTKLEDQSTDISVGTTTMTTTTTPAVSGTTGTTRWRVPAHWRTGSVRASSRLTTRATTSTGSTNKKSWTSKAPQVRHASDLGS